MKKLVRILIQEVKEWVEELEDLLIRDLPDKHAVMVSRIREILAQHKETL